MDGVIVVISLVINNSENNLKAKEIFCQMYLGYQFPIFSRTVTMERMTVYSDMEASCCMGDIQLAEPNIHTDSNFAKSKGLPDAIADGLVTTAWIESILRDIFGPGYIEGGSLMNKYIKVVMAGDTVNLNMVLKDKRSINDNVLYMMDFECVNQKGEVVVVGSASATISR